MRGRRLVANLLHMISIYSLMHRATTLNVSWLGDPTLTMYSSSVMVYSRPPIRNLNTGSGVAVFLKVEHGIGLAHTATPPTCISQVNG